jgi:adenylate cyclase, class 2
MEEVEIKFAVADTATLAKQALALGFVLRTATTHERNTLFDDRSQSLRKKGALLRLRSYGGKWKLTSKRRVAGANADRHKLREELETEVINGEVVEKILRAIGFTPIFVYEKFRAEWDDGKGHLVIDETPVGRFAELEGPAEWIDAVAAKLGVAESDYITASYAELFAKWKRTTKNRAKNMTFAEAGARPPHEMQSK